MQCSGVLVAPNLVLYAGHCGDDVATVTVAGVPVKPLRCAIHESTRVGYPTDIAYCLLHDAPGTWIGAGKPTGKLTGYGYGSPMYFGGLRSFPVDFKSYTTLGSYSAYVPSNGVCHGDSGGPVFDAEGRLVGIASAALLGQDCNLVERELRLAYYVPITEELSTWIGHETGIAWPPAPWAEQSSP